MNDVIWYVYIVECVDQSLYTGISIDYKKRIETHNSGKGSKALRGKRPVVLVHLETYRDESEARKREIALKKLKRLQKIELIKNSSLKTF